MPPGQYFMMGDNRDNSADSRYWGFVPDKNIVGKAFLVWMNFNDFKRIGNALTKQERRRLEADLEELRSSGYAESAGEVDRGVWASAAIVHAGGISAGALSIVAPDYRLDDEHKRQIADAVRSGADAFRAVIAER